jgi:hypothetical protein
MIIGPNRKRYCVDDNAVSSQTTGGGADLRVKFALAIHEEDLASRIVEVDPRRAVGGLKVDVCKDWGIDPRTISVFRVPNREMYYDRRIDPTKSFLENRVKENDVLLLSMCNEASRTCPSCLKINQPVKNLGHDCFDCYCYSYHCVNCGWRWRVVESEIGHRVLSIEDEERESPEIIHSG